MLKSFSLIRRHITPFKRRTPRALPLPSETVLSSRTNVRDLRKISRCGSKQGFLPEFTLSLAEGVEMTERLLIVCLLFFATPIFAATAPDLDDRTRAIAAELRCVVCQNLSVADSPSEMAQQMKGIIREQLQAGKTPAEIKNYFVSKYGEWVLLAPSTKGFGLVVWLLPFVALLAGLGLGIWLLRRWVAKRKKREPNSVEPALLARVRQEATIGKAVEHGAEDSSQKSELIQERTRLYADLKELEFDFQAGKLSATDYGDLRQEIESKAVSVLQRLDALSESVQSKTAPKKPQKKTRAEKAGETKVAGLRGWRLAAGGAFLLLFGLALGVALTKSLRPRASEGDTMTGDFLTGTGSPATNSEVASSLQEGKAAFAKQDWAKAIDAFKKALASDPNQAEAHAYMGFILVQAGHADGALMAFDKALAVAPNFPMALWGKGMTLYQAKQDYAGAREAFEKLLRLMPPGQERSEVEKVLAEISPGGQPGKPPPQTASAANPSNQISGKITLDPKLTANVDKQATLFIIARPAGAAGGPPLAVKKIDRPVFPLSYSLGSENVMMQGRPFAGKVTISVRLDKDGNPTTRQPGDLTGETKNPVDVGAKNIDIVLDQVAK
jgi:cytochrome c-type biogenesis protein CcmH